MTDDAPADRPGATEPEKTAVPAKPKRRLTRLRHQWVTAVGTALGGAGTVAGLIFAFGPAQALSGGSDHTLTQTVVSTVTETDTVQATASTSPGATTSGAPSGSGSPATSPGAPSATPRPPVDVPTTTTAAVPRPGTPAGPGDHAVRFSGELAFGDFNLDYQQPRNLPEHNVYRIQESRLYADDPILLVEWPSDATPGYGECAEKVSAAGKSDATGLVAGSHVCGRTPEGRVFRIEVLGIDANVIRGRVTVWEK